MAHTTIFSEDYAEAREKFLAAARQDGALLSHYQHPHLSPHGEALYTDVANVGPRDAPAVLVICSGTHGIEGFAGSGIQTGLLRCGLAAKLQPGQRIVFIHALNPYGFAHVRRANEDNVDVNRNFLDHAEAYPENLGYESVASLLEPRRLSRLHEAVAFGRALVFLARHGRAKAHAAVSRGQHVHANGLFFGGTSEVWSNTTLRTIAAQHVGPCERMVFADLHTGLGAFGHGTAIIRAAEGSPAFARAQDWWGDICESDVVDNPLGQAQIGSIGWAQPSVFEAEELTSAVLEFGTLPAPTALFALRAENSLHHFGGANDPAAQKIRARLRRAFYPDSAGWRDRVWKQGLDFACRALTGLATPGAHPCYAGAPDRISADA